MCNISVFNDTIMLCIIWNLSDKLLQECKLEKLQLQYTLKKLNRMPFCLHDLLQSPRYDYSKHIKEISLLHVLSPSLLLPPLLPHSHTPSIQFWGQLWARLSTWSYPFQRFAYAFRPQSTAFKLRAEFMASLNNHKEDVGHSNAPP